MWLLNEMVCNCGNVSDHLLAQVNQEEASSARLALDGHQTPIRGFSIIYLYMFSSWSLLRAILIWKQDEDDASGGHLKQLRIECIGKNPCYQNWGRGGWGPDVELPGQWKECHRHISAFQKEVQSNNFGEDSSWGRRASRGLGGPGCCRVSSPKWPVNGPLSWVGNRDELRGLLHFQVEQRELVDTAHVTLAPWSPCTMLTRLPLWGPDTIPRGLREGLLAFVLLWISGWSSFSYGNHSFILDGSIFW